MGPSIVIESGLLLDPRDQPLDYFTVSFNFNTGMQTVVQLLTTESVSEIS